MLQVTVTDGASAVAWVVAVADDRRTALRWADHHRVELRRAGCGMADVGVWDTSTDRWVYDENENS